MRNFKIALGFLTIFPVTVSGEVTPVDRGNSLSFYPVVGLIIGIVVALVGILFPVAGVGAAMALAVWVAITGALHLDGLGDMADGWLGGVGDKERTLEIMKDPLAGSASVVTLVMTLLVKFAAIESVLAHGGWLLLALVPMISRTVPYILLSTCRYVRPGGLGEELSAHIPSSAPFVTILTFLAALLLGGMNGLWIVCATLLTCALVRYFAIRRLGGVTGDIVGACIELAEAFSLVALAVFIGV